MANSNSKSITVERALICPTTAQIDAYSAGEPHPTLPNDFINYLSGNGMAGSIGLANNTTIQNRMSKELKALLGEGFTTIQGRYKNSQGGISSIKLWTVDFATEYYGYHARKGNQLAFDLILALAKTSLDVIINDAFKREYVAGSAENWAALRMESKALFKDMTAAIQLYQRSQNMPEDRWDYINCSNAINRGLFGMTSKQIRLAEGIKTGGLTRDCFGRTSLGQIGQAQRAVAHRINQGEGKPYEIASSVMNSGCFIPCNYKD